MIEIKAFCALRGIGDDKTNKNFEVKPTIQIRLIKIRIEWRNYIGESS